jgi:hypothetical protein
MHHEEIELNFDASCQQILGLELEILCESRCTPTLGKMLKQHDMVDYKKNNRAIYHIISYHIISYHIISYHIISYHIISYHIMKGEGEQSDNGKSTFKPVILLKIWQHWFGR